MTRSRNRTAWHWTLAMALFAPFLVSCKAPYRYFRPAESARVETIDGFEAAEYQLEIDGKRWGQARIWCEGALAIEADDPEDDRTILTTRIEVENNSDEAAQLILAESTAIDVRTREERIPKIEVEGSPPPLRIGPRSVATAITTFELPYYVDPREIDAFRLQWVLVGPGDNEYNETTNFVPGRRRQYRPRYRPWRPWGWFIGVSLFHRLHHHH